MQNVRLALDLSRRDLETKYKRSMLGWMWLLLTPLCLLAIYTVVFGYVFGIEWKGGAEGESIGFSLPFFVGLSVYLMFTDLLNTSANLFVSKRTFVIKSPFPLWVLWLANFLRASVHGFVALLMVLGLALIQSRLTLMGVAFMLVDIILILAFMASISLIISSIGPFIGDISEGIRLMMRVLFYATPITYPLTLIESPIQEWMWLNPLTCMVVPLRSAIVFGTSAPLINLTLFTVVTIMLGFISVWMFRRLKEVIPDVV